jgi:hypothetical protein
MASTFSHKAESTYSMAVIQYGYKKEMSPKLFDPPAPSSPLLSSPCLPLPSGPAPLYGAPLPPSLPTFVSPLSSAFPSLPTPQTPLPLSPRALHCPNQPLKRIGHVPIGVSEHACHESRDSGLDSGLHLAKKTKHSFVCFCVHAVRTF